MLITFPLPLLRVFPLMCLRFGVWAHMRGVRFSRHLAFLPQRLETLCSCYLFVVESTLLYKHFLLFRGGSKGPEVAVPFP